MNNDHNHQILSIKLITGAKLLLIPTALAVIGFDLFLAKDLVTGASSQTRFPTLATLSTYGTQGAASQEDQTPSQELLYKIALLDGRIAGANRQKAAIESHFGVAIRDPNFSRDSKWVKTASYLARLIAYREKIVKQIYMGKSRMRTIGSKDLRNNQLMARK